ncbi:ribonuclease HI [Paraburkholderia caribensis]|uniref:ribonuclease HI n=1 Tax=Paraburkholderia caribensis TaxID=75105 RepID=UPI0020915831|nr:ribonuclease HI [Paraburkholderia caribensis]MCO4879038.1 ribonuclease HI [Paraburkholderia caribensis]
MTTTHVEIFTDGGCYPNPGVGGWAAILRCNGIEKELVGGEVYATNNRMELMGAIAALEALKRPCTVTLHTDSQYMITSMTNPRTLWRRDFAKGKPVKNLDLLQRLEAASRPHSVIWKWVRGHSGHIENERVDKLATRARVEILNAQ